ncbi:MAG: copper-binding protein [Candidatus Binatia bacterium]
MKYKGHLVASFSILLTGCATYQLRPVSINHPANPDAMAAPGYSNSKTLAYTRADMPSPAPVSTNRVAGQQPHDEHHQPGTAEAKRPVEGEGKVVATVPSAGQIVVEHGKINGFMEAMTMGYRIEPTSLLEGLKSGDQVRFTIDPQKKTIIQIEKVNK